MRRFKRTTITPRTHLLAALQREVYRLVVTQVRALDADTLNHLFKETLVKPWGPGSGPAGRRRVNLDASTALLHGTLSVHSHSAACLARALV